MKQTIFVTGASGYIAKHLLLQLLAKGYSVRGSLRSMRTADQVFSDLQGAGADTANLSFVQLDLGQDDGWDQAMEGADVLMHTASPFPLNSPKNEDDLIRPAVDGTMRALRAAKRAGIKRVILTSSTVAIVSFPEKPCGAVFTEDDWADLSTSAAYGKSKTLAEQAAWDFVKTEATDIALTTINLGLVLGPPIGTRYGSSLAIVERALSGKDPMVPDMGFSCVDVRDIAALHIAALERPATAGERFAGVESYFSFSKISEILRDEYPDRKIAKRVAPNFVMRLLALFDPAIKGILPALGQRAEVSNAKARTVLGHSFYDTEESLRSTARFLVEGGRV